MAAAWSTGRRRAVAVGSADEVVDDKVAEAWQRGAVPAASRRFSASLSIGLGMRWGTVAAVNLVKRVASPHLLFIELCDGSHQPHLRLGVPD